MSLETLLEAARYLEYKSEVKARGEEPHDYYTFVKLYESNHDSSDISSPPAQPSHPYKQSVSPTAEISRQTSEEVTKERRRSGPSTSKESHSQEHIGSGTREVHNKLEKNRRAHLKECFEALKRQLPNMDDRKTSNLSILRGAIRHIQTLKRKEREQEHDLERLAREKIAFQQRLALLKKDLSAQYDHIDINAFIPVEDNETTTTASECGGGSDLDDLQSETSQKSNANSRSVSDAASSISSSATPCSTSKSGHTTVASAPAFPSQTSFSSVFSSVMKSSTTSPPKINSLVSENIFSMTGKNARLISPDGSNVQLTSSDISNSPPTRVISANSLQAMTGILTSPHAVQVIAPSSNIKLLAAQNSINPLPQPPATHRPQNQIHVLTSSSGLSYVASSTATTPVSQSSPHPSHEPSPSNSKQLLSPVTLVSSPTFVGFSQVASMAKPLVINQTTNFSDLMMANVSNSLTTNHVLMKPSSLPSSMFGTNVALTIKNSVHNNTADSMETTPTPMQPNSSHANKSISQIIQPLSGAQNTLIHSEGLTNRQISSSRPHGNLFNHGSNIPSHLTSSASMSVPPNQLISPQNHVTSLVGSVSVVSHTGAVHHQILAQSQPIGKVLTSPILKSINPVNSIPILQQQFLQASGNLPNQQLVKPVVVVSMPNIIPSGGVTSLPTRPIHTAHEQKDTTCSPSPGQQK